MNQEDFDQILQELQNTFSDDELQQLADATMRLGVLDAVVTTGGTNVEDLALWLYHEKMKVCSLEEMELVVRRFLPDLEAHQMIVDGKPTEEAVMISMIHQMKLKNSQGHDLVLN